MPSDKNSTALPSSKKNAPRRKSLHPAGAGGANKIVARGPTILAEVGLAPIFQNEATREFPIFARNEIDFGKILGMGAFGVVREVTKIHLEDGVEQPLAIAAEETNELAPPIIHNYHYDISFARDRMVQQYMRQGEARYAVKYLRTQEVSVKERARGRVDLAIEIKYLHALNHPNIVKMRGYFETDGDEFHPNNFFLMDRLYGTLEDRIDEWSAFLKEHSPKGVMRLLSKSKRKLHEGLVQDLLQERIVVAYDIASAFRYMHSHKLVYRDIKLENIGFDIRGDIKIFDFGLAKSLIPDLYAKNGLYHLTACTGSIPYVAPEVAKREPYNEKCDVYSFGMLFWEILELQSALEAFPSQIKTPFDYGRVVIKGGCRPTINPKWPIFTKQVLKTSWITSIIRRPSMNQICTMLQADLKKMTTDENVVDRTAHMMQKSSRSWRGPPNAELLSSE